MEQARTVFPSEANAISAMSEHLDECLVRIVEMISVC